MFYIKYKILKKKKNNMQLCNNFVFIFVKT